MEGLLQSKKLKIVLLVLVIALLGFIIVFSILNYRQAVNGDTGSSAISSELDGNSSDSETSHADILDEASLQEDEGEQIIYISKDEVYNFSMTDSNGIVLGFELTDDKWIYHDDSEMKINQDRIDKILNYLCDVRSIEILQNADGNEYGLNQDSKTFTLGENDNNYIIISIGNTDEATGHVYFAINYDFSTVYVNSGKLGKVGEYGIEDLL